MGRAPHPSSEDASAEVTQSGPNYAYVDPTAEDTMVVQLILASRMGTRELESDEEDENAFEVPREQLSKFTGKAPPTKSQLQEAIEKAATEAGKTKNNDSNAIAILDGKPEVDKAEQASEIGLKPTEETTSKAEVSVEAESDSKTENLEKKPEEENVEKHENTTEENSSETKKEAT